MTTPISVLKKGRKSKVTAIIAWLLLALSLVFGIFGLPFMLLLLAVAVGFTISWFIRRLSQVSEETPSIALKGIGTRPPAAERATLVKASPSKKARTTSWFHNAITYFSYDDGHIYLNPANPLDYIHYAFIFEELMDDAQREVYPDPTEQDYKAWNDTDNGYVRRPPGVLSPSGELFVTRDDGETYSNPNGVSSSYGFAYLFSFWLTSEQQNMVDDPTDEENEALREEYPETGTPSSEDIDAADDNLTILSDTENALEGIENAETVEQYNSTESARAAQLDDTDTRRQPGATTYVPASVEPERHQHVDTPSYTPKSSSWGDSDGGRSSHTDSTPTYSDAGGGGDGGGGGGD